MEEKRKFFMILAQMLDCTLYTIQKKYNSNCYVFEPSFSNLKLIQNNIALNNLEKKYR